MKIIDAIQKGGYECLKSFLEDKGYKREFVMYDPRFEYITKEKMKYIHEVCDVNTAACVYQGLLKIENGNSRISSDYDEEGNLKDPGLYPFYSIAKDYFMAETFSLFDKIYSWQHPLKSDVYRRYYYKITVVRRGNTVIELFLYKYKSERDEDGCGGSFRFNGSFMYYGNSICFFKNLINDKKIIPTNNTNNSRSYSRFQERMFNKITSDMGSEDWTKYLSFVSNNFSAKIKCDIGTLGLEIDYINIVDEKLRESEIANYYKESKKVAELTSKEIISGIGLM